MAAATLSEGLVADLERVAVEFGAAPATVSATSVAAFVAAWTQLFGYIGFELTNQTRGLTDDQAGLFAATAFAGGYALGWPMAAVYSVVPVAGATVAGATALIPGTCAYQTSRLCACWQASWRPAPTVIRTTSGTLNWPPDM